MITQEQPRCFGKLWEATNPECVGGPDTAFTDPHTGSHIREMCGFYEACGTRKQASTQAAAMEQIRQSGLVPTSQITRFQRPVAPAPAPVQNPQPMGGQQGITQFSQQFLQQMAAPKGAPMQQMLQAAPQMMPVGYQQMMPVNFHIPQYLTVREERSQGDGLMGLLLRELGRSMGKSVGHTLANFFDTTPMRWK